MAFVVDCIQVFEWCKITQKNGLNEIKFGKIDVHNTESEQGDGIVAKNMYVCQVLMFSDYLNAPQQFDSAICHLINASFLHIENSRHVRLGKMLPKVSFELYMSGFHPVKWVFMPSLFHFCGKACGISVFSSYFCTLFNTKLNHK